MGDRIRQLLLFLVGAVLLVVGGIVLLPFVLIVLALALVGAGAALLTSALRPKAGLGGEGRVNVRVLEPREREGGGV
jgi:hypothetical protein